MKNPLIFPKTSMPALFADSTIERILCRFFFRWDEFIIPSSTPSRDAILPFQCPISSSTESMEKLTFQLENTRTKTCSDSQIGDGNLSQDGNYSPSSCLSLSHRHQSVFDCVVDVWLPVATTCELAFPFRLSFAVVVQFYYRPPSVQHGLSLNKHDLQLSRKDTPRPGWGTNSKQGQTSTCT